MASHSQAHWRVYTEWRCYTERLSLYKIIFKRNTKKSSVFIVTTVFFKVFSKICFHFTFSSPEAAILLLKTDEAPGDDNVHSTAFLRQITSLLTARVTLDEAKQ